MLNTIASILRPCHGEENDPSNSYRNEYDEALEEIERYFENEPKPGTPEADPFDLLTLIVEDYER